MMSWVTITNYLVANWLEILGAVTAVLGIWLTTRRLLACWPIILISDVACLVVVYRAHLKSDAWLQVFFIAFTLYGWWNWARGVREEGEVRIARLPLSNLLAGLTAGAAGSYFLGTYMEHHGAAYPYVDASLSIYSLVASWWQARKHIANWWLWIVIDLAYIGMYLRKDLKAFAVLSAILVALAVLGLRDWNRAAAASKYGVQLTLEDG
jgi:nicotinamide mononucleotide transporter